MSVWGMAQAASASTARQLDRSGALAMLSGQRVRFLIKRSAFTIGRPTSTHGAVSASYHLKLVCFADQYDLCVSLNQSGNPCFTAYLTIRLKIAQVSAVHQVCQS